MIIGKYNIEIEFFNYVLKKTVRTLYIFGIGFSLDVWYGWALRLDSPLFEVDRYKLHSISILGNFVKIVWQRQEITDCQVFISILGFGIEIYLEKL